jgi:aspartyl-tRNA(Asn)/glutamyl-tRNA(Gln) amidotransferase subunit A
VPDYRAGLARGIAGVRIARAVGEVGVAVDPEVGRIADEALATFGGLGASVDDLAVPSFAPLNALRRTLMLAEAAAIHEALIRDHADAYVPQTTGRMMPGFALEATAYAQALMARGPLLERFCAAVFAEADILALPTSPIPTPRIDDTDTGGDAHFVGLANTMGGLVGPFNYLGLPAISLPVGFDRNGMPVGLQLVGKPFAEGLLLRAAHAFERTTGVANRRPPA